jgi:uncharacterized protein (TIGR02588 family)
LFLLINPFRIRFQIYLFFKSCTIYFRISLFSYISLTSKAEYHNLEILETDFVRDSGTYTIKASNISGDKESNCEVRIEGSLKKSEKTASKEEADLKLKTDLNGVEEKRDSKIDSAGLEEKRDSKVDSAIAFLISRYIRCFNSVCP